VSKREWIVHRENNEWPAYARLANLSLVGQISFAQSGTTRMIAVRVCSVWFRGGEAPVNDSELQFWQQQAENGLLIETIRAQRERAIAFFGANDVLTEREAELCRTLEAHWLSTASEEDIVLNWRKKMNTAKAIDPDFKDAAEEVFSFTIGDARDLKKQALKQLKHVFGQQ